MRIYTGDIREVVPRLILAETVDCIIADCPYGETSLGWDRWVEGWPAIVDVTETIARAVANEAEQRQAAGDDITLAVRDFIEKHAGLAWARGLRVAA
jgi:hypothetical protein